MKSKFGENFLPWIKFGKTMNLKTPDEIKQVILGSDEVKDVMANLARQRAKQYENHL